MLVVVMLTLGLSTTPTFAAPIDAASIVNWQHCDEIILGLGLDAEDCVCEIMTGKQCSKEADAR